MKIVRIIARLNVGGPARHVIWLTKALQGESFQSVLVTGTVPDGEEDMSYFAHENGITPIVIPEMSRELSIKDLVSFIKIYKILLREKPDIIHTHTAKAGTLGRLAGFFYKWLSWGLFIGKPRKVKLIHTYHGHIFHSYYGQLKTKFFLLIEKTLAFFATDKIVVISDKQFEEIHEKFGVGRRSQFVVIPLGIDLQPFLDVKKEGKEFRREIRVKDDEILVGIVGRLTEIKNHKFFLRVVKLCHEKRRKVKFVIIGEGHLRAELEQLANKLGINDAVVFAGNRKDISFYGGLDVVALTSLNEGTPLSLIEAMASGIPVISTMVGGVVDLLGKKLNYVDGFIICERGLGVQMNTETDPNSHTSEERFCNALIYLIENKNLCQQLTSTAREFVFSVYSKERLTKDLINLYENLLFKNDNL
ncbi:MAG: glycosyltransferase family 1 protein [Acidobacteria bacterium]|nr:MAG: glycosyltransferase family 1 protein [Acidobacteriota bacterium]